MAAAQPSFASSCPANKFHAASSTSFARSTSQTQRQYYPTHPIYNRNLSFVRSLILALTISFVIITAVSIITWLILHPRVPLFQINTVSVSNFTLSDTQLTGKFDVNFTVTNPNRKINLEFKSMGVTVSLKRTKPLARASVSAFNLRKMNRTEREVELNTEASEGYEANRRAAIKMMGRDWRNEVVNFRVRMVGVAKFELSDSLSQHKTIGVFCDNLGVRFGSDNTTGKLLSPPRSRDCLVQIL
ncbi:hypothetical protein NMG60_11033442 [Bertholletia excelsa]